jgi:hypothetical protein
MPQRLDPRQEVACMLRLPFRMGPDRFSHRDLETVVFHATDGAEPVGTRSRQHLIERIITEFGLLHDRDDVDWPARADAETVTPDDLVDADHRDGACFTDLGAERLRFAVAAKAYTDLCEKGAIPGTHFVGTDAD